MKNQTREGAKAKTAGQETEALMGQFRKIVAVWGADKVMNDPIVSINTRICQALIKDKDTQATMGVLEMATKEAVQHDLKVQTMWTVIYLFSLKSRGVKVVVQEPPLMPDQVVKRNKYNVMSLNEPGMYWSKPEGNVIQRKQPLVRIIPIQDGLHLELRRVTSFDGLNIRSTYMDSWVCDKHMMKTEVDTVFIDEKLAGAGFALQLAV